jgi:hypothetical protein
VAEGLTGMGFGCAEGRANRVAVQVWCRRAPGPVEVQLVADPAGRLLYARFDLVLAGSPAADLRELLDATVLRVWPGDRNELAELVRDAAPRRPWDFGSGRALSSEEQFTTGSQDTGHARYELQAHTGEPMVLEVRTPALRDRSWPYGGEHYATTTAVAFPRLQALGFTCTDDQCHRAADDQHLHHRP